MWAVRPKAEGHVLSLGLGLHFRAQERWLSGACPLGPPDPCQGGQKNPRGPNGLISWAPAVSSLRLPEPGKEALSSSLPR